MVDNAKIVTDAQLFKEALAKFRHLVMAGKPPKHISLTDLLVFISIWENYELR